MKISNAFPSKFLRADDLPQGRRVKVEIADVRMEVMEQSKDQKPVCYFAAKDKAMVLNVTNANVIAAAFGDETDAWTGREIELYRDKTTFAGRVVDCIRVAVPVTSEAASVADAEAAAGDDIPF